MKDYRVKASSKREKIAQRSLMILFGVVGLFSALGCAYGHAALSRDLFISGEATVGKIGGGFTSKYLQDLTPTECDSVKSGVAAQLIDKRDDKSYWIAKIGSRCVMTQDLKLRITTAGLTSELTDLNPGRGGYEEEVNEDGEMILKWNAKSTYPPKNTFTAMRSMGTSYTTTYSMDFGDYALATTSATAGCKTNTTGISACSQAKYVGSVMGVDEETGEEAIVQEAYEPTLVYMEAGKTFDAETRTYDAHYLIGTYYQYLTATAGSAVRTKSALAPSSICPRGWKLPTSAASIGTVNNDFAKMLAEYTDAPTAEMLNSEPFYISGAGFLQGANIYQVGMQGAYWTDRMTSTSVSNVMQLGTNNMATNREFDAGGDIAHQSRPVRCILREAEEE